MIEDNKISTIVDFHPFNIFFIHYKTPSFL